MDLNASFQILTSHAERHFLVKGKRYFGTGKNHL